jgi:selenide,water dikinase
MESLDDAGVYKLTDDLAIIQTVDFFTPIVDDPYMFGQISAANSLSDVYTMGGRPITAMNLVCFPIQSMDISILKDILRGGQDKMNEAGVILVGGHSVDDTELKYGLSVTGTVHPDRLVTNSGAKPGDSLVLTKPLGTGIINTAVKAEMADQKTVDAVAKSMAALNGKASELMLKAGVNACTDITGFGFLGHALQMAKNSGVSLKIKSSAIPHFPEAVDFARQGLCPAGLHRNREFYSPNISIESIVPLHLQDILYDPQTSGGLLISVPSDKAENLLESLHKAGVTGAAIVGEVSEGPGGTISVS